MRAREKKRVTLREVAAAAGVSTGTASQALHDSALIRPETRARVLDAARRLNYVPDRNAARLLQGRSDCIGIAFAGLGPAIAAATFYALVVRGLTRGLEEHGYTMRFLRLDDEALREVVDYGRRRALSAHDLDGIVVLNWQDTAMMDRLQRVGAPLVVVDASSAYPHLPSVDNDDRGGVAAGVDYLLRQGHRHIALLNIPLSHPFGREALAGYMQAFAEHGVAVEPWLLHTNEIGITEGRLATAALLGSARAPTAIFAVADELAVGAMQAITEASLRVPEDVSVVGMDDIPLAAQTRPALTTVRIDMETLGQRAIEMLLRIVAGSTPDPTHLVLPTQLIVRDSAAPPSR